MRVWNCETSIIVSLTIPSIPYSWIWALDAISIVVICTWSAYTLHIYNNHICTWTRNIVLNSNAWWAIKLVACLALSTLVIIGKETCVTLARLSIPSRIWRAFCRFWYTALSCFIPFVTCPAIFAVCTLLTIPTHIWRANGTKSRLKFKEFIITNTLYSIKVTVIGALRNFLLYLFTLLLSFIPCISSFTYTVLSIPILVIITFRNFNAFAFNSLASWFAFTWFCSLIIDLIIITNRNYFNLHTFLIFVSDIPINTNTLLTIEDFILIFITFHTYFVYEIIVVTLITNTSNWYKHTVWRTFWYCNTISQHWIKIISIIAYTCVRLFIVLTMIRTLFGITSASCILDCARNADTLIIHKVLISLLTKLLTIVKFFIISWACRT